MLKATSSIVNVSQITGVLPVVNGGTGVTTSTGTGNTVLSAAPTLSGNVTLSTGNLVVANGQGIDFSATPGTGTSELFDDYEEGDWTPSVGGDTTYFHQWGTYVKVGRQVSVIAFVYINTLGTGSTTTMSGLPFTSSNTYGRGCVSFGEVANIASLVSSLQGYIPDSSTSIEIWKFGVPATGNTSAAIFGNQTVLYFSATYIASA